ncbi:MAG: hypothetical protein R3C52_03690 [Hyphomonadaceae bacterium]
MRPTNTSSGIRLVCLAAISALALAACSKPTEPASDANATSEPTAETSAAADDSMAGHDMAGHDMPSMDESMAASDAADDANTAETEDGFMFHTYPNKTEKVHLPTVEGETWVATPGDASMVAIGAASDETMPDGAVHHVVAVDTLASGNTTVTFELKPADDPTAAATETRTIHFMIH